MTRLIRIFAIAILFLSLGVLGAAPALGAAPIAASTGEVTGALDPAG